MIATINKILTLQRRKAPPYANFLMLKIMACDKKTSLLYDDFGQVTNKLSDLRETQHKCTTQCYDDNYSDLFKIKIPLQVERKLKFSCVIDIFG